MIWNTAAVAVLTWPDFPKQANHKAPDFDVVTTI